VVQSLLEVEADADLVDVMALAQLEISLGCSLDD
jgi:hypothetical protein